MNDTERSAVNPVRALALAAIVLAALAAGASAANAATLIVDGDRVECSGAGYTSIQDAVEAAQSGDLIRVCPDTYSERVVIDKPLTLKGDPHTVDAVDCFDSTPSQLGDADPTQHAIVDPPEDGDFSIAFKLNANGIELGGFVVEGASVGIDASDHFSGYRVHHNLIRLNTLFGVDFGSEGTGPSRIDHNCLRSNGWGVVSELDDDSAWPAPKTTTRSEEARTLKNATIDHNQSTGNTAGIDTAGPGLRERVTIYQNRSSADGAGIIFQHSADSVIAENEVADSSGNSIVIGGDNLRLLIADNQVRDSGRVGLQFVRMGFLDTFAVPSIHVTVQSNDLRSSASEGIAAGPNNLANARFAENVSSDNGGAGIVLNAGTENDLAGNTATANRLVGISVANNTSADVSGNTTNANGLSGISVTGMSNRSVVAENMSNDNRRNGIVANAGVAGVRFERNLMFGNGAENPALYFDANDLSWPNNTWTGNTCGTDNPAGEICGVG